MFDCTKEYEMMLQKTVPLSGEDKQYFIRGRLQDLCRQLPVRFNLGCVLDFGFGIGQTTQYLAELFPIADIIGFNISDKALAHAQQTYGSARISFCNLADISRIEAVDLCYANGVFHHIIPEKRFGVTLQIHQVLKPGGYFTLFENNPLNPRNQVCDEANLLRF